ncbi:MAG: heme ABC exporter ATP-binding protein CcmA [Candidatus Rokubacteria bacterium]|nr:heme ABC exporter ATP-binding protein CcmA [Candidatus Rokubacteria bacterium]
MIGTRGIRKVFGVNAVLDGVTLDVAAGECVAVLGANGTGKSTLLRIAATTMRPTAGTVTLFGHDAVRSPERVRGRIGFVAHGAHVWDDLTALENIRVWRTLGNRRADAGACMEALATVELEHAAHERARDFSAGMKRRLSIARYVDGGVDALLLDEPFTALDQQGKKWLAEFLLAFKARGGAVLMATHDFGRSLEVADRLAILADGVVVLDRPRGDLGAREVEALYRVQNGETA